MSSIGQKVYLEDYLSLAAALTVVLAIIQIQVYTDVLIVIYYCLYIKTHSMGLNVQI